MSQQTIMSHSHDNEDGCFVAMDTEDNGTEPAGIAEEDEAKMGSCRQEGNIEASAKGGGRTMLELPEEVLEYILSFLSPYQEHKTAALVCKQWYRLIKGIVLLESGGGLHEIRIVRVRVEDFTRFLRSLAAFSM